MSGSVGLLFTHSPPAEVADWFNTHERKDYARTGNIATRTVILPEGPILTQSDPSEPLAGPLEPQLRKLGIPTELKRGVPTLRHEFTVCREGKRIDTNAVSAHTHSAGQSRCSLTSQAAPLSQAQVLKHLLIQQASFRIIPLAYHDASKESIFELELTPQQQSLVQQANGKNSEAVPGSRRRTTRASVRGGGAMAYGETGMDENDDDDGMDETSGDHVTESMMLPAHLA